MKQSTFVPMRFDDYYISSEIKKNLAKLGFKKPTDIQFKAIPNILNGEDVLAIAQTGTGKTAAFGIPVIDLLHKRKIKGRGTGIKALVMVPTRELAIQINEVLTQLSRHTRVKTFCTYGGVDQDPQIAKLQKGVDILVSTPGRMFDLVAQGHCDLHQVEILILDEADQMLDLGFIDDIHAVSRKLPPRRQTLFFSATINPVIKKLAYTLVHKPIRIQISPKDPVSRNVDHSVVFMEMDDKRFFLEQMVKDLPESKMLVFARTQVRVERIVAAMARAQIKALAMHGSKSQSARSNILQSFKNSEVLMLVATDVTARGIDIADVDIVVNYDLPTYTENYVHRVGRTGRGRKRGVAYSFCSQEELPLLEEIESFLGAPIKRLELSKQDTEAVKTLTATKELTMDKIISDLQAPQTKKRKKKK